MTNLLILPASIAAAFLVFASSPASAQNSKAKHTRDIQARYGECVVERHTSSARRLVLDPALEGAAWRRTIPNVANGDCLVDVTKSITWVELTFPHDTLRYLLAEALVRRELWSEPVRSFARDAPLAQPKFNEADYLPKQGQKLSKYQLQDMKEGLVKKRARVFLSEFGECVVRQNPERSFLLLKARPATSNEEGAFKALAPQLSNCLPAGQQLAVGKVAIRGTIAMNYYRLAQAPRLATPAEASK